jgi:hypothetical protein
MTDRREQILVRLLEVLATVEGILAAYRDRGEFPDARLPAAVLLDGKESMRTSTAGRGHRELPPSVFILLPQIYVILRPRKNITNDGVGEELSSYRVKVLKAILQDEPLRGLLGANGEIEFRGSETDMQSGSTLTGQLRLDLAFYYPFIPNEL